MEYKFTNIEQIEVIEDSIKTLNDLEELSVGVGNTVFHSDSSGIWLGANKFSSAPFSVTMEGILTGKGAVIEGTIKTSNGSTRIEMNGDANEFRVYNAGNIVASFGAFDGNEGELFNILYNTNSTHSPFYVRGNVPNASLAWFHNDGGERAVVISSDTDGASGALFVRNGTSTTIGDGIAATFESNSVDPFKPCVYIKGVGTALRLNGNLIGDDIIPRSNGSYYLGNSSYKYAGLYASSSYSATTKESGGMIAIGDDHVHYMSFNTVSLNINGTTYNFLVA